HAGLLVRPGVRAGSAGARALAIGVIVIFMETAVGMPVCAGALIGRLDATLNDFFAGVRGPSGAQPSGPLNQPTYRWDGTERITFLLLGIDSGVGRKEALTDTILAVSIDPVARTAVMISVPRDTGFV